MQNTETMGFLPHFYVAFLRLCLGVSIEAVIDNRSCFPPFYGIHV